MPGDKAMREFKAGTLHSGSKRGPKVTSRKQAIAIMMHENEEAGEPRESARQERAEKPSIGRELGRAMKKKRSR